MAALQAANFDLHSVATRNLRKARGRFVEPDPASLPTFDEAFPPDERLPENFEIIILQRPNGQTCLQWNGVFIGDPPTDNIADTDGYRYHDVFHLTHAAVLHWSPTFRSLIKHKRKTCPKVDEAQDGGRAINARSTCGRKPSFEAMKSSDKFGPNGGGVIVGDRSARTIAYRPLADDRP